MQQPESVPLHVTWQRSLAAAERSILWLSRKTGIHYRTMYRLCHGQQAPTTAQQQAIAQALELPS